MVISIQLQTVEDISLLEPVLKLLQQYKTNYNIQSFTKTPASRKDSIRNLIDFVNNQHGHKVTKIEIPPRDERNER